MAETPSTPGPEAESSVGSRPDGSETASGSAASDALETVAASAPGSASAIAPVTGEASASDAIQTTEEPTIAAPAPISAAVEPQVSPEAVPPTAPSSAPAQPPSEPPAPAQPAGVAASLSVPALDEEPGSGGEWELLVSRVQGWLGSGEPQRQWQKVRGPLKGLAILIGLILALRVYSSAVGTIDSIPVVSGLLELAGLIASLQFVLARLVRARDRDQVIGQLKRRWQDFRGRG